MNRANSVKKIHPHWKTISQVLNPLLRFWINSRYLHFWTEGGKLEMYHAADILISCWRWDLSHSVCFNLNLESFMPSSFQYFFWLTLQQPAHLVQYSSVEHSKKAPLCNPYPPEECVISIITSHPQSEHLSLNTIVDLSGVASNIFFNFSNISE